MLIAPGSPDPSGWELHVLYRVRIGEDEYIGRADEVVAFMARAEGAPGTDAASYMAGVAGRLRDQMGIEGIPATDPTAFLDALDEKGILPVETFPEPTDERIDPDDVLGDGPVALGEDVDPDDLPL